MHHISQSVKTSLTQVEIRLHVQKLSSSTTTDSLYPNLSELDCWSLSLQVEHTIFVHQDADPPPHKT